jgi:hypothetical protein
MNMLNTVHYESTNYGATKLQCYNILCYLWRATSLQHFPEFADEDVVRNANLSEFL